MSQVTIYLKLETEKKIRKAAKQSKLSVSQWILRAAEQQLESKWPEEILALSGTWKDFPEASDLRKPLGDDLIRESF